MNKLIYFAVGLLYLCMISCEDEHDNPVIREKPQKYVTIFETSDLNKDVTYGDSIVIKANAPYMIHSLFRMVDGKRETNFKQFIMTQTPPSVFEPQQGNHYWLGMEHPTDCTLVVKINKEALGDSVHTIYLLAKLLNWHDDVYMIFPENDCIQFNLRE